MFLFFCHKIPKERRRTEKEFALGLREEQNKDNVQVGSDHLLGEIQAAYFAESGRGQYEILQEPQRRRVCKNTDPNVLW